MSQSRFVNKPDMYQLSIDKRHDHREGWQVTGTYQCFGCTAYVTIEQPQVGTVATCWKCGVCSIVIEHQPYSDMQPRLYVQVGWGEAREVKAEDVYRLLQVRHAGPEWIDLPQVRTRTGGHDYSAGTGLDTVRTLDAFAMHCWPSKGFERHGYEIKVSRADWRNELADPRKRAQGYYLTHYFWYALGPGVYRPGDEIDVTIRGKQWRNALDGCGILEVGEDGTIKVLRAAKRREPFPLPDSFIASLMRSYVAAVTLAPALAAALEPATTRDPASAADPAEVGQPGLFASE